MALKELSFKLLEKVLALFEEKNTIILNFKLAWYDRRTSCSIGNKCNRKDVRWLEEDKFNRFLRGMFRLLR